MFKKIAFISTVLTLCVVVLGAYVRLSDAGLGCPDWPGCYGTLTVPQSNEALEHAHTTYPESPVENVKAWKEMAHRYVAGILGLLVFALFIQAWRERKSIKVSPWLPTALVGIIGFQAMLGMWTVTMLLKPAIVTMHLMGGMTTLAILTWISHRHWGTSSGSLLDNTYAKFFVRFAIIVLFFQIFLGGWTSTNYAALACTDFPTCHGAWIPEMDFTNAFHWFRELGENKDGNPLGLSAYVAIQWIHRIGALITLLYIGSVGLYLMQKPQLSKLAVTMLILLLIQIGLGIANLLLYLPTVLAVAHNMVAALLLITVIMLNSKVTAQNS
jgi:cytochrome c oxidase assembly protein subunit 15